MLDLCLLWLLSGVALIGGSISGVCGAVGLEVLDLCCLLGVGRCGPDWGLQFWCWWGWVAAVGLEVLDLCFLLGVGRCGLEWWLHF